MSKRKVMGNRRTLEKLKRSAETGSLAHAYIFEGPDGIGKKTISIEFAKMILCTSEQKPCQECSSCRKVESGNHPDLFVERPERRSGSKASYTVSDIERIQSEMRRRPNESEKKVFIITEGEKLSVDSQNKFLKTIEEPPENVVTIILTNNSNKLLKTTLSRCQTVKLERVSESEMKLYIEETHGVTENIDAILAFSDGNIGRAEGLLSDENFRDRRERTISMISDVLEKDVTKVFYGLKLFEDEKDNVSEILDVMSTWFRDVLVVKKTGEKDQIINSDKFGMLKTQADVLQTAEIYGIVNRVEDTRLDLERNVNYQLATELLLLKISEMSR